MLTKIKVIGIIAVLLAALFCSLACDDKSPTKPGGGGQEQPYDPDTGRYK